MRFHLIFFLFPILLFSQESDTKRRLNLVWDSHLDAGSEHVSAQFINKYLRRGFISSDVKNSFFDKLESSNTAGAILNSELSIRKYRNSSDENILRSYFSMSLEHYSQFDASFTKDLFGLYFFGNQRYENQKADLSGMRFSELSFQTFKLGIFQRIVKLGLGINLGYVMGQSHIDIETNNSYLFTAQEGRYIDFAIRANANTTNIDKSNFFSSQGKGISADIRLYYQYKNQSFLGIQINRLGMLKWNDDYKEQFVDTLYRFEGIEVTSLLDSFTLDLKSPEELKDELVKTRPSEKRTTQLPAQFSLLLKHDFIENKLWLNSRVNYMRYGQYKPSFQCDLNLQILKLLSVGIDAGVGGYSTWNAGISAGINLIDRIKIEIKARSLFNVLNLDRPAAGVGSLRIVLGI